MKSETKVQHATQAERGSKRDLGVLLHEQANPQHPTALATFAVADLPAAADYTGHAVFCSNGAAGSPCMAVSDGTNWKVADGSANVSAS